MSGIFLVEESRVQSVHNGTQQLYERKYHVHAHLHEQSIFDFESLVSNAQSFLNTEIRARAFGAHRCICIKSLSLWWFWETKFYLLSGYIFRFKKSFSNYSYELWPLFITRRRKMLNFREKNLCCGIVTWNH